MTAAVDWYLRESGLAVGALLRLAPEGGVGPTSVRDASHGIGLAGSLAVKLRAERRPGLPLHLFIAAPNALLFFLGQCGALGRCSCTSSTLKEIEAVRTRQALSCDEAQPGTRAAIWRRSPIPPGDAMGGTQAQKGTRG